MDMITQEFLGSTAMPWQVILLRLLAATLFCGLIGAERESRNRPAGLRTHMLVGMAAATYCILMLELTARYGNGPENVRVDPIRIVEAVTSGVAFLAAGLIVFSRGQVHGLTTGAGMWLSAAIGVATGLGLWPVALIATVLALVIFRGLKVVERRVMHRTKEDDYDSPD